MGNTITANNPMKKAVLSTNITMDFLMIGYQGQSNFLNLN